MKKTLVRIIALLMVFSCAFTLFGCQEEEDSIRRKRSKKKENTEEVTSIEETLGFEETLGYEGSKSEQLWDEEKVETEVPTLAPPVVAQQPDPGSIQLTIAVLFGYNYDTLCTLNWFTLKTEQTLDGRWILTTEMNGATFTFLFNDLNDTAYVVTVDDTDGRSDLYITYDMQLGDTADELPTDVYNELGAMDGGFCAPFTTNGYDADLLLYGERDSMDDAVVYAVQLRRRN